MTDQTQQQPADRLAWLAPAAGACWAAAAMFNPKLFGDQDTNWHLATGQLILRTGSIPTADPFSWPAVGRPWVAHEWLSEVVMALAFEAGSWTGLALLATGALAIILTIVAIRAGQCLAPQRAMLAVIIVAAALAPTMLIRPHMLAFVLQTIWTMLLIDARRRNRAPPLWSGLILILWVNMHASWILGIGLAGVFGLEAMWLSRPRLRVLRDWSIFGAVCLAVTLMNPQGIAAWVYPFEVNTMSTLRLIVEWRPMDVRKDLLHLATMVVVVLGVVRLHRQVGIIRTILLAGLMVMAALHIRYLSVFVLVSSLVLLDAIRDESGPETAPGQPAGRTILVSALVILCGFGARLLIPLDREDSKGFPAAAIAAVPAEIRAMPVINFYDYGGALILAGIRPYVDGRADMYGDAHMQQYERVIAGQPQVFRQLIDNDKVGWIIVHPSNGLRSLAEKWGWRRIHADQWAVVLVRPDLAPATAPARK